MTEYFIFCAAIGIFSFVSGMTIMDKMQKKNEYKPADSEGYTVHSTEYRAVHDVGVQGDVYPVQLADEEPEFVPVGDNRIAKIKTGMDPARLKTLLWHYDQGKTTAEELAPLVYSGTGTKQKELVKNVLRQLED